MASPAGSLTECAPKVSSTTSSPPCVLRSLPATTFATAGVLARALRRLAGSGRGRLRAGWLFRQNQLVRLRDAQAVLLAAVHDDHLTPALKERRAVDAADGRGLDAGPVIGPGRAPDCQEAPEGPDGCDSETQVGLLHVGAREQARPRALEHQAPVLEHVAPMRELERARHVLLDEHDRRAGVVDALERLEDELHRHRRETEARLVQQEQPRPRHEPAPDRAHLLLAARQGAGQLTLALAQAREEREDHLERVGATRAIRRAAAELEVVAHGHRREELTALRHVSDAARDDLRRPETVEPRAVELDAPGAHRQEPADRPQGRRLAGAVPADQRDRLTLPHLERDLRDRGQVTVAGLDTVKPEQRGHT